MTAEVALTRQTTVNNGLENPAPRCLVRDECEPCESCGVRGSVQPRYDDPPEGWYHVARHEHPHSWQCASCRGRCTLRANACGGRRSMSDVIAPCPLSFSLPVP